MQGKQKMSFAVLGYTLIAALGGLLFGFDTAVISGTVDALQAKFALSNALLGFTVGKVELLDNGRKAKVELKRKIVIAIMGAGRAPIP